MYAIVKTGGKQYRVERGQRLLVERLPAAEGSEVTLQPILFRSEQAIFDKDGLAKVTVTAKVLSHERGQKLRVFKFKPKRGYKRRTGHRQELTRIEVTELGLSGAKAAKKTKESAATTQPAQPKATAKPATAERAHAKAAEAKTAEATVSETKAVPAKRAPTKPKAEPKADAKEASEDGA